MDSCGPVNVVDQTPCLNNKERRDVPFQKIDSARIADAITAQFEQLILQGILRPGQKLPPERELAERFDVSRPTLREALHELEERGLIASRPGGANYVAEIVGDAFSESLVALLSSNQDSVFDYLEFRRDLEGLAAARAAEHATESDREYIREVFARMLDAHERGDAAEEAEIDAELHMAIVEAAHNIILTHVMRSIYGLLRKGVFYNRKAIYRRPETRQTLLAQHRAIYEAVMEGNAVAARAAVEAHLDHIRDRMEAARKTAQREERAKLRLSRGPVIGGKMRAAAKPET